MARDDIAARLRAARPGASRRHDPLSPRALAELEQYERLARTTAPATPAGGAPRRGRPRGPALALGVLALAVLSGVAGVLTWANLRPVPALALTPPPLAIHRVAGAAGAQLAAAARERSDAPSAKEPTTVRSYQWALESSVGEDGTVTSQPSVPQRRTLTFAPDGGVTLVARAAAPFRNEVTTGLPPEGTVLDEQRYRPGRYDNPYVAAPPTRARAERGYLSRALGVDDPTAGDYLRAVGDLMSSRPITAAQEAAVLRFLGRLPQLRFAGTTTDRLGRAGEVFVASDRRPGEYEDLLVVSPSSGRILAGETVYVGHDRTDIPSPATTVYVAWDR